jgi:DNA-binding NarL/FixJ family response regulator
MANAELSYIMFHKILLADDHSLIRKSLKLLIEMSFGMKGDIAEVSTCTDLMKEVSTKKYTHLILDLILADDNALTVIPDIRRVSPDLRIFVFSMQPPSLYGKNIEKLGIYHYCSKTTSEEETMYYLQSFLQNKDFSTPRALEVSENPFSKFTSREYQIFTFVIKGMGTKEIAVKLNLKSNTVSTFKNQIFEKTQTANLRELIELATLYKMC